MSNLTPNMGFNTFLESEAIDFEKINENFEKLDGYALCIESGEKTAAYSGGASGNVTWRYKKYSDGTIELYTKLDIGNLRCSNGGKAPYESDSVTVNLPLQIKYIDDVHMHVASSGFTMIHDITAKATTDSVLFKLATLEPESINAFRRIYIGVKGR